MNEYIFVKNEDSTISIIKKIDKYTFDMGRAEGGLGKAYDAVADGFKPYTIVDLSGIQEVYFVRDKPNSLLGWPIPMTHIRSWVVPPNGRSQAASSSIN